MRLFATLLLSIALAACVGAPRAEDPEATVATEQPQADAGETELHGEVDYSCEVDTDCAVRNIGNCCGYYPACVNRDSPTFPDRVMERCQAQGIMSICGFPEIAGCTCVEGRCRNVTGPGSGLELH
jgi:hypothetical protein